MCLVISHPDPVTLGHPLTVWKVITEDHLAPYHHWFAYSPHKTYRLDDGLVVHWRPRSYDYSYGRGEVEEGFHAYLSLDTAIRERKLCTPTNLWTPTNTIVVEFTIPVGATVYYGTDSSIVSDAITAGSLEPINVDPEEY